MKNLLYILIFILLTGCTNNYRWGWYILNPNLENGYSNIQFLLTGLSITVSISILSIIFSLILGFLISLLGFSKNKLGSFLYRITCGRFLI